jgi:hypothetical protein
MKKNLVNLLAMFLIVVLIGSMAAVALASTALEPSETLLGDYRDGVHGGFSYRWLAYIINPEKDAEDQSLYIELNGQRLGPYSNLSSMFQMSADGEHIAFAAYKDGMWHIIVDGQDTYEHQSLAWRSWSWNTGLKNDIWVSQTNAVKLQFSPNGDRLAYQAYINDSDTVIFLNGIAGPVFNSIDDEIRFVDRKITYIAWDSEDKPSLVYGDNVLGPYDEIGYVKYSSDGKHFVYVAKKQGDTYLVIDGQEQYAAGATYACEIGPSGEVVYLEKSGGKYRVNFSGRELPGEYDKITELTISPDGKHLAFWAKTAGKWSVITDSANYPGFDSYYYYEIGGENYSIMWDSESMNIAYFAKEGEDVVFSLNGQQQPDIDFVGSAIAWTNYVDADGNNVGQELLWGSAPDKQAIVEYLMQPERFKCDPAKITKVQGKFAYIETGATESFAVIGTEREGPFASIKSNLLVPEDHQHYAYVIETELGQQMIVDGKPMEWIYDEITGVQFVSDKGIAYMGVRDGKVYGVFYLYQ